MEIIKSINLLRARLKTARINNNKTALVPTMGNLHAGHLALVKQAKALAETTVVTIFVNPTQFVDGEDFDHYPRTLDTDLGLLEALEVDLVFTPETDEIYSAAEITANVTVPELDSIYCGKFRPGHFKGVATVVTKLFNIVQPDIAVFGNKDYQQLLVIKSLVKSLKFPIELIAAPTLREKDGLALSSRNQYLTAAERKLAAGLYQRLCEVRALLRQGVADYKRLEDDAVDKLEASGFVPEYFSICDADTLKSPKNQNLVIIAAAWLGKARLIDNIAL